MRPWTSAELEALRILGPLLGSRGCAESFCRSRSAIKQKARELGVSLRRPKSLQTDFRPLCGAAVQKRIRQLTAAELCPACGKRFVGVRATGLCGPCHLDRLREVHEEEIAKADAELELWSARSKLYRRRRMLAEAQAAPRDQERDEKARD